jgi:anti-sigma factor ChrR (cupin superfamily)
MRAKKSRITKRHGGPAPDADLAFEGAAALLALAAPVVAPPARVKTQLLERVRAAKAQPVAAPAWRFEPVGGAAGWVALPFPGVRMREITIDPARDTALLFVEMAPGSVFPDHDHTTTERGVVLTGDLSMSGRTLAAGDFYEAAAGTRHERIASRAGCTGLLWVGAEAWRKWRAAFGAPA